MARRGRPRLIDPDLRIKIVTHLEMGGTVASVARELNIKYTVVYNIYRQLKKEQNANQGIETRALSGF